MLLAGVFVGLLATVCALYTPSDDVVELNPSNFNNLVIQGDELWLVEFYAPWLVFLPLRMYRLEGVHWSIYLIVHSVKEKNSVLYI